LHLKLKTTEGMKKKIDGWQLFIGDVSK
jgi:hypothetical protein